MPYVEEEAYVEEDSYVGEEVLAEEEYVEEDVLGTEDVVEVSCIAIDDANAILDQMETDSVYLEGDELEQLMSDMVGVENSVCE